MNFPHHGQTKFIPSTVATNWSRSRTTTRRPPSLFPKWFLRLSFVLAMLGSPAMICLALYGQTGRWMVVLTSGVALSLCFIIMQGIARLSPLKLPLIICGAFALQLALFLFTGLINYPTVIDSSYFQPDFGAHYLRGILPLLTIPISALGAVLVLHLFLKEPPDALLPNEERVIQDRRSMAFLFASGILFLLFWPATAGFGIAGYFIRVLWQSLGAVTFFAGRYAPRHRHLQIFWLGVFAIAIFFSFILGSRGYAFRPLALFVFGWSTTLWERGQFRGLVNLVLLTAVAVILFGLIGNIRDQIGRDTFDAFSSERITTVFDSTSSYLADDEYAATSERTALQTAVRRMIVGTNPAVTILTDEVVPRRTFKNISGEISAYFDIAILSGRNKVERLEAGLGTAPAISYGFRVNTETNVPMPVLADGWSRSGLFGAILFGFIACFFLSLLEWLIRVNQHIPPTIRIAAMSVLIHIAFFSINSLPLFPLLRQTILNLCFSLLVVFAAYLYAAHIFRYRSARHARSF